MVSSSLHPLGAPLWASRCVPNLKPAPRARAPASQKDRCVSVCCLCSSLRVAVCQELPFICYSPTGSRNTSVPGLQSQVLKGCPLGSSHKKTGHQTHVHANSRIYSRCSGVWQRGNMKIAPTPGLQKGLWSALRCVFN